MPSRNRDPGRFATVLPGDRRFRGIMGKDRDGDLAAELSESAAHARAIRFWMERISGSDC